MPRPPRTDSSAYIEPDEGARAVLVEQADEIAATAVAAAVAQIRKRAKAISRQLDRPVEMVEVALAADVRRAVDAAMTAAGAAMLDDYLRGARTSERKAAEALGPVMGLQRYGVMNAFGQRWRR